MRQLTQDELAAYVRRIGMEEPPDPDLGGVASLHRAHLTSIPFESLDIHLDRPITIDIDSLVTKMVTGRRGGFCYENNSLFAAAVATLGVTTTMLSARVAREGGGWGPPFDHLVLRAEFDGGPTLLDVGFGEGFRAPLPIDDHWHDQTPSAAYRARAEGGELVVEHRRDGEIRADYLIDLGAAP